MTLKGSIKKLQEYAKQAGVKEAPDYPTEGTQPSPFSIAYPAEGSFVGESAGQVARGLITIYVELHHTRTTLPIDVEDMIDFIYGFAKRVISDPTLSGECDTVQMSNENKINFVFGKMEWADEKTIGIRFEVTIKLKEVT
jgi:hypothetical protein